MGWRCYCCDHENAPAVHGDRQRSGATAVFYCCEKATEAMHGSIVLGTPVEEAEEAEQHFVLLAQFPTEQSITNPAVPYVGELPVSVHPGRVICVQGRTSPIARRFTINLSCGLSEESDLALHLNPRFDERRLVRNYRSSGRWGEEESSASWPFPLVRGQAFTILIFAAKDEFLIAVNGRHYCSFSHRLVLSKIIVVQISGDVDVDLLEYRKTAIYPEQLPSHKNPIVMIPFNQSVRNICEGPMATPFTGVMEEFGIGHEVEIIARVKILPHSFYVNLQHGAQVFPHPIIPLHINPRFQASHPFVRNAWVKGRWGVEEKATCSYFRPGRPFCLRIVCEENYYVVYVDGLFIANFKYRCSPEIVDTLYIHGDVWLKDIVVR